MVFSTIPMCTETFHCSIADGLVFRIKLSQNIHQLDVVLNIALEINIIILR